MEKNLLAISMRYAQLRSDLIHGNYRREFMEEEVINVITDELLSDMEMNKEEVKKALINMFALGKLIK